MTTEPAAAVSVVVPVMDHHDDLVEIHHMFSRECERLGFTHEFLFVVHGDHAGIEPALLDLERRPGVQVIRLAHTRDQSAALNEGFRSARGRTIVTLPAYHSVDPAALGLLLDAVAAGADCAVAVRARRSDPGFNRLQARLYASLISLVAGRMLRDISTGAAALRSTVARSLGLYGDQHRYLPVLVLSRGFRLVEVEVPQSTRERKLRLFGPSVYLRRMMDLTGIFFLVRFTRTPLRFFGTLGAVSTTMGLVLCAWLAWERLFHGMPLASRPALLLGLLLVVLGVQLGSIGLLGELMVSLEAERDISPRADEITADGKAPGEIHSPQAGPVAKP